ncbi:MAG TPA: hypothetical protein VIL30_01740 [Ramlibacter sp.]|jgi:hypothetical protein
MRAWKRLAPVSRAAASMAQGATAATESLKEQAGVLLAKVSRFQLSTGSTEETAGPTWATPVAVVAPVREHRTPAPGPPAPTGYGGRQQRSLAAGARGEWAEF